MIKMITRNLKTLEVISEKEVTDLVECLPDLRKS